MRVDDNPSPGPTVRRAFHEHVEHSRLVEVLEHSSE